jgi:hypothetical protein
MHFRSHSSCHLFRSAVLCLAAAFPTGTAVAEGVPASVTAGFAAALGTPVSLPAGVSYSDMPLDGSWKDSCTDARVINPPDAVRGLYLFASCRKIDGSMVPANINIAACGQPPRFGNQDGKLVCESGYRADIVPGQANGSWIIACGYDSVSGMTLSAICSNNSNGLTKTSLNFGTCAQPAQIAVVDGQLTCGNGPRTPPVQGSWSASCLNEKLSGASLSALCFAINGQTREASLDLGTCNAPAAAGNQDGTLVCESGVKPPVVAENTQPAPVQPQTPPITTLRLVEPAPVIVAPQQPPPVVVVPQSAPVIVATPAPAPPPVVQASPATPPTTFAGSWTVLTERGDSFALDMRQTGNAASGTVAFGGQAFNLNGSVLGTAGEKMSLVWQVGDLAGTGELTLGAGKQDFAGKLLMGDGTPLQGGVWKGTRAGSGPALPFGEVKAGALPQVAAAATATPAAGYERAVSTTELAIRNKPSSKDSKVLGSLKTGEVVSVRCPTDNRYWCELQDGRGWVSRQYINIGATATATPTTTPTAKKAVTTTKATTKKATSTAKTAQPVKKQEAKKEESGNTKFFQGLGLGVGLGVLLGNQ